MADLKRKEKEIPNSPEKLRVRTGEHNKILTC